jgi:apolipoprotein N-acyltransferase
MMKKSFQWLKQKRWPFLAGLLVGTTYIPFPPWALLFCYVPLWVWLLDEKRSLKDSFWGAWITQFTLTLIGFHWIAYTAHEFGGLPWSASLAILLLFAALMHLYIPLAVVVSQFLRRRFSLGLGASLLMLALTHSLAERAWPSIFEWHLGYTLIWAKIPVYQLADLVGFEGLSTWILLLNAWFAFIWIKQSETKKALRHLAAFVAVIAGLIIWGNNHLGSWNQFDSELKVGVAQANIGNLEKVYAEKGRGYQSDIIERFLRLSTDLLNKYPDTDLLMWPETAYPDYLDSPFLARKNQQELIQGLMRLQKPVLTGAYSKDEHMDLKYDHATYNALFLVNSQGISFSPPYRKTYLLAFGEYLPFSETFPILLKLLPFVSNFGRGQGPALLTLPHLNQNIKIGGQICYEGLYSDFSRGLALKGAEILANVTNDSWFGRPFEPNQHLYMTLAKAIETRRPLVRSTNTGISTAILADGEILQKSPLHEEWDGQFVIRFKKNPPQTFYVEYGHWDWVLMLLAIFALTITGAVYEKSRRS